MAKVFVSPGVFTNEIDASFLPAAIGSIGAAFVGLAQQGPAFVPYTVSTFQDYAQVFGDLNESYAMTYAAKAYLRNSATAKIVRVLGPAGRSVNGTAVTPGYTAESMWGVTSASGSSLGIVHALIQVTGSAALIVNDLGNDLFDIRISGSSLAASTGYIVSLTASMLTGSQNYIKKVLNTDPTQYSTLGYFVHHVYDYATKMVSNGNARFSSASYAMTNFQFGFNSGSTPWFMSQDFGGGSTQEFNLFRVHTLGHGHAENGRLKVSIANVKASSIPTVNPYGQFDLEVRSFADTDRSKISYEVFPGVTLDPASPNYLPRRVGDKFWQYDATKDKMVSYGNFGNVSKLIRVEMTTGSFPQQALPWGFRGLAKPNLMVLSGAGTTDIGLNASVVGLQNLPLVKDLLDKETQGEAKSYVYWGTEFDLSGSVRARLSLMPTMTGSDSDFSLKWVSGSTEGSLKYDTTSATKKVPGTSADALGWSILDSNHAQFTAPVAFGFDGFDIRLSNPISNESQLATVSQLGTQAVRQAVDTIKDPDFVDINMLVMPGLYQSTVTNYAIQQCETRADALCLIEVSGNDVATATTNVTNLGYNSNYAATYYPGVKIVDPVNNKIVNVPPSVPACAAIAYTDRVSYPWYAPAGLTRGALNPDTIGFTVVEALDRLTAAERDTLYENRINPIASFPAEGVVIWGQKTLQQKSSALDRVNVRRLLIRARKLVASAAKLLVFEPNNPITWTKFKQLVNPILADIQVKNGLDQFLVVMDSTTNTPDIIDRNVMAGKIFLVPTRTGEFVAIDFVVSRTGATFSQ
jgi:hypothetical protein